MTDRNAPFSTIESAQEFLALLSEQIDDALNEIQGELSTCELGKQERRVEAWRVVLYTMTKLSSHVAHSRRLLNDLRTLRNLMHRTSDVEPAESEPMAASSA